MMMSFVSAHEPPLALDRARIALDRSVRTFDEAGRLHVASSVLTRSCVSDYGCEEIPGWQDLGLTPGRTYALLRDPDELRKGLATFNRLPILSQHVPVSSTDYRPDLVIGATGEQATFNEPELTNSLTIWAQPAIDDVLDGSAKALSCGYWYKPVMQKGNYRGARYDGVMTEIKANHLATVPQPRVLGAVVGDSARPTLRDLDMDKVKELFEMLAMKLSSDDYTTATDMIRDILSGVGIASDDPPLFPGQPLPGGRMINPETHAYDSVRRMIAGDRVPDAYERMFPNTKRLHGRGLV